jgi:hypothetical protein
MAEKKEPVNVTKIGWSDIAKDIDKSVGIPAKTSNEVMNAVSKYITQTIKEKGPKKEGDTLFIKTPIAAYAIQHVAPHIEVDKKGKKYEVTESVGFGVTAPNDWVNLANEGFTLSRKEVTSK